MLASNPIIIKRTDSNDPDFQSLVVLLDADLANRDGELHAVYSPHNKLKYIDTVLTAYLDDVPVGCGAFKAFNDTSVEVKRMFVKPDARGNGIAKLVLKELELWAAEKGFIYTTLETGKKNPEAVNLYQKQGYHLIDNYGPYIGMDNSICMQKTL